MRRYIFVFTALFAAVMVNAQITLEHTFDGVYYTKSTNQVAFHNESNIETVDFPFFYTIETDPADADLQITFVNPFDYSTYKTINLKYDQIVGHPCTDTYNSWDTGELITSNYGSYDIFAFTYNILVPNKVAFIVPITTYQGMGGYQIYGYYIVDEDGKVHKSFLRDDGYDNPPRELNSVVFTKIRNEYKLITYRYTSGGDLYGGTWYENYYTDVYSLPGNGGDYMGTAKTSAPKRNACKYINNDQVLINSNDKTYTVIGQELK